jgi:hypothetical protein
MSRLLQTLCAELSPPDSCLFVITSYCGGQGSALGSYMVTNSILGSSASRPNHLPEKPPPHTLGVRISTYGFGRSWTLRPQHWSSVKPAQFADEFGAGLELEVGEWQDAECGLEVWMEWEQRVPKRHWHTGFPKPKAFHWKAAWDDMFCLQ